MKKPLIISIIAVVILAAGGYFIFARSGKPKYEFRYDQVSVGDLAVTVTATGAINPVTIVEVGTQVSGTIMKLFADFNSIVKEGQVIAQIDPTFLQQSVKDAEASLQKARAQLEDSRRIQERAKVLLDKQLASQETFDAALTNYETNQAAIKQAQASLDRARINLSYATIYAPIDGVVIDRKVNVGQTVAASFSSPTLFTIANDLRKMQVQTIVDESDIGKVSIGQKATFTVDAYPEEKFTGTVAQIRLAAQSVQNVVNYTVIINVENDQLKLMPGMTANVKILVAENHDATRVPNMALRFQPPADLVDSTKIKAEHRDLAERRRPGGNDSLAAQAPLNPGPDSMQIDRPDRQVTPEMRAKFRRDRQRPERSDSLTTAVAPPKESEKFGITRTFPEYQKSAYVPDRESGMGKVWILNSSGKLEPVFVRTGLSDGKYTEIFTDNLKAGDKLVVGASTNGESTADQARSPFGPQSGRPMGGRF
jgi:HlyD family secretion protein